MEFGTWALEGCALSAEYLGHAERELLSHAERRAPGQNLLKLTVSLICLFSFGNLEYLLI